MWFENSSHRSVVQTEVCIYALINWWWRPPPPPSSFHYILILTPAAMSLFVTSLTHNDDGDESDCQINFDQFIPPSKLLVGWTYNTLHMFRLAFPCTYIYICTYPISKTEYGCILSLLMDYSRDAENTMSPGNNNNIL